MTTAEWADLFRTLAGRLRDDGPREGQDPRLHEALVAAAESQASDLEQEAEREEQAERE